MGKLAKEDAIVHVNEPEGGHTLHVWAYHHPVPKPKSKTKTQINCKAGAGRQSSHLGQADRHRVGERPELPRLTTSLHTCVEDARAVQMQRHPWGEHRSDER